VIKETLEPLQGLAPILTETSLLTSLSSREKILENRSAFVFSISILYIDY
jgi:hypothetical protein